MQENELRSTQNGVLISNTTILNSMPYCVFWKDKKLNYVGGNSYFLNAIGASSMDEIIGKSDYDCQWASKAKSYRDQDTYVLAGNNITNLRESRWNIKGNSIVAVNKIPLKDHKDRIIGVLGLHLESPPNTPSDSDNRFSSYSELELFSSLKNILKPSLTYQEIRCMALWLSGYSIKESSYYLGLSHKTIEVYRKNIKDKMGVHHKRQLIELMQAKNAFYLFLSLAKLSLCKN